MNNTKANSYWLTLFILLIICLGYLIPQSGCKSKKKLARVVLDSETVPLEEEEINEPAPIEEIIIVDQSEPVFLDSISENINKKVTLERVDTVFDFKIVEVILTDTIYQSKAYYESNQQKSKNNMNPPVDKIEGDTHDEDFPHVSSTNESIWGRIAYYCEREMREEHTYDVIVALSNQEVEEAVREAITSSIEADRDHEAAVAAQPSISTETLRVADEMTVELIDPAGDKFKIVPIHKNETQSLKDGAVPEWKWKVTPKAGSCCEAELTVLVTMAGKTSSQTFTIKVLLKENLFSSFKKAVIDDPKWLVSVIIIPLLTFFVGVWRGRRKKKVNENV